MMESMQQMSPYTQNPWGIQHCLYRSRICGLETEIISGFI